MIKPKPAKFISANQPIVIGLRRSNKKATSRLAKLIYHLAYDLAVKDSQLERPKARKVSKRFGI